MPRTAEGGVGGASGATDRARLAALDGLVGLHCGELLKRARPGALFKSKLLVDQFLPPIQTAHTITKSTNPQKWQGLPTQYQEPRRQCA